MLATSSLRRLSEIISLNQSPIKLSKSGKSLFTTDQSFIYFPLVLIPPTTLTSLLRRRSSSQLAKYQWEKNKKSPLLKTSRLVTTLASGLCLTTAIFHSSSWVRWKKYLTPRARKSTKTSDFGSLVRRTENSHSVFFRWQSKLPPSHPRVYRQVLLVPSQLQSIKISLKR